MRLEGKLVFSLLLLSSGVVRFHPSAFPKRPSLEENIISKLALSVYVRHWPLDEINENI